jgi:CheY-like chemotaxis protein
MMPQGTSLKLFEILMVEDSPSDALITREALDYAKLLHRLHVVEDGVRALAFLRREGPYAQAPRPDLILLDLNLPRKDGREVLVEVKADDHLKTIPVVVLTTSRADEDILRAYGLHANCYITKPVDFVRFADVVRAIEHFWFTIVTLPPEA